MPKSSTKKWVGGIAAVVLGGIIALSQPPDGLTTHSMHAMGILLWAVLNWIFDTVPSFVIAIMMCALWAAFGVVSFSQSFGAFASTTWWILIGALGIGLAAHKSGLLKRISLLVLGLFPPTFNGQVLALFASGTAIAPLIPSTTVKCIIAAPLANGIADTFEFKQTSKERDGLFCAMYTGYSLSGTIFVSASILGYTVLGVLPIEVQAQFTWFTWFISIPWAVVVMGGLYLFIIHTFAPETETRVPVDYIQKELSSLGMISRDEKLTLGTLITCLIFWIGETIFNVPAVYPAIFGLCALLGSRVLYVTDFNTSMGWNMIFFMGSVINLVTVLPAVGIDKWLSSIVSPILSHFVSNIYLLIIVVAIIIYIGRVLITSLVGSVTLFTIMLTPTATQAGINPWIMGAISYVSAMVWYFQYQNVNYLAAFAAAGGEGTITHRGAVKLSIAYMILSLVGLLISVPYWRLLGLIP